MKSDIIVRGRFIVCAFHNLKYGSAIALEGTALSVRLDSELLYDKTMQDTVLGSRKSEGRCFGFERFSFCNQHAIVGRNLLKLPVQSSHCREIMSQVQP